MNQDNHANGYGSPPAIDQSPTMAVEKTPQAKGLMQAATSREVAEVQAALVIARANPRDVPRAIERIQLACQRQGLAAKALYQYARGGKDISGPSIRLAEAMAQAWGNLDFGVRELEQRDGESVVEAYAWDMETNTRQRKTFQVPHLRKAHGSIKAVTDPRDIYELVANNGARRMRACILGVIPGDIQELALEQCQKTLKAHVNITPERLKKMLELFEGYGVTKAQIEQRIQRKLEAITPAQFLSLGGVLNSLNDGMGSAADYFTPAATQPERAEIDPADVTPSKSGYREHGEENLSDEGLRQAAVNKAAQEAADLAALDAKDAKAEKAFKLEASREPTPLVGNLRGND